MKKHIIQLYTLERTPVVDWNKEEWNHSLIRKITGHKLIDSELLPKINKFKTFIRDILWKLGWLTFRERIDTSYKKIEIDTSKILDLIRSMANDILYTQGIFPEYIIVGHDYLEKIKQEVRFLTMINHQEIGFEYLETFFGMKIVLVPWIDGVFLLPELDARFKEQRQKVLNCFNENRTEYYGYY